MFTNDIKKVNSSWLNKETSPALGMYLGTSQSYKTPQNIAE